MNDQHKQALHDQFDDAAFALLMDAYAEEEGARLLREFEESAPHEQIPESLDKKCRRMIDAEFSRARRKARCKKVLQMTAKAAAVVLVVLALSVATIMSVDALRIPVINFIIEHTEHSSVIRFEQAYQQQDPSSMDDPLAGVLPERYVRCDFRDDGGMLYSVYQDEDGNYAQFHMTKATGEYCFDSEDTAYENRTLAGHEALYLKEDDRLGMIWIDEEEQIIYNFQITGITEEEFFRILDAMVSSIRAAQTTEPLSEHDPLIGLLPDDYQPTLFVEDGLSIFSRYENAAGDYVSINVTPGCGNYEVGTENAVVRDLKVLEHDAFLVVDDGFQLVWVDNEGGIYYDFQASALPEEEVLRFGQILAEHYADLVNPEMYSDELVPGSSGGACSLFEMGDDLGNYLADFVPLNYEQVHYEQRGEYIFAADFRNEAGDAIHLETSAAGEGFSFDPEGMTVTQTTLVDQPACFLTGDGYRMLWLDEERGILFDLSATNMEEDPFLRMCKAFAVVFAGE